MAYKFHLPKVLWGVSYYREILKGANSYVNK